MQRAIKAIKNCCPEMLVMTDVALDHSPYGHDGIGENGQSTNDPTAEILAEMSLVMPWLEQILLRLQI